MKQKKIRWGIVGLGRHAEKIAAAIEHSRNGILTAVSSNDIARARIFAARRGSKIDPRTHLDFFTSPDIDAIFITSKNHEHAGHVIAAANAKKHVVCEKPFTLSYADGIQARNAIKKNNVLASVGFHLRYHPAFRKAREIIDTGALGTLRLIQMHWSVGELGQAALPPLPTHMKWRENVKKSGGGSIIARGTHLFDLIRYLFQTEPRTIIALADNDKGRATDTAALGMLELTNGFATFATSRLIPNALNSIVIYGSDGRMELTDALNPYATGVLTVKTREEKSFIFEKKADLYQKEVEDFADAILHSAKPASATIKDGLAAIRFAQAFTASTISGKKMGIKLLRS